MTILEKIQSEIKALPPEEYAHLRQWLLERDWAYWDAKLERDVAAGKLDFLFEEARAEKAQHQLKEL